MHLHREIWNLYQAPGNHDPYPDPQFSQKDAAILWQMVAV